MLNETTDIEMIQYPESSQSFSPYQPPQPMWISVLAAVSLGPIANIFRVASVYACQEFEEYSQGSAGVTGNVMNTAYVPWTTIYAFLFYRELMTVIEFIGSALVVPAIIVVTVGKVVKHFKLENCDDRNEKASNTLADGEDDRSPLMP